MPHIAPGFKARLRDGKDMLTCVVCTIPSAVVPQALAAAGIDSLIIDLEHGAVDYGTAHAMIAATQGTPCAPLVRIAENNAAQVKRALDLGAEGIVFPLIRTAQDAADAVAAMRYPPRGVRGFGPFIAQSRWGTSLPAYRADIEDHLVCCLLIETPEAVDNIDAICAVEGIDLMVVAAFDLTTTMGISGQFDHPDFIAAVAKVEAACATARLPLSGVALRQEHVQTQRARGYRVVAGFDILWLRAKADELSAWIEADPA